MKIIIQEAGHKPIEDLDVEIVERKGVGHPDSLADGIAEAFSQSYSQYCLEHFGVIANHWVDKVMVLGGESEIQFGFGRMVRPIRVVIAGKVTAKVGDHEIPVAEMARNVTAGYMRSILSLLDPEKDLEVLVHTNDSVGAGRTSQWYRPTSVADLHKPGGPTANDTVVTAAYAPLSRTERLVLDLERKLNDPGFKQLYSEVGTDIKVLAFRTGRDIQVVAAIPFIASRTPSRAFYDRRKNELKELIHQFTAERFPDAQIQVNVNTRDDEKTVYMTHLGTAADTGDVGVVGRGNRVNGLISPCREMSLEAPCGKNPVYHGGKLYSLLARCIADEVYKATGLENYVNIVTQTGRPLDAPLLVAVKVVGEPDKHRSEIVDIVNRELRNVHQLTYELVSGRFTLF